MEVKLKKMCRNFCIKREQSKLIYSAECSKSLTLVNSHLNHRFDRKNLSYSFHTFGNTSIFITFVI